MRTRAAASALGIAAILILELPGPAPAAAASEEAAGCDPRAELCLLDPAPWVAPQNLRYRGPAATSDSLRVRWAQGQRSGEASGAVLDEGPETVTWRVMLPARLRDGEVTLTAVARSPRLEAVAAGPVRRAAAGERLRIRRHKQRFSAIARLRARADVRVALVIRLRGRYPAERWEIGRRWRTAQVVRGGERVAVRLWASRARGICRRYARCRLHARLRVQALGERLAQRKARRSVPTPPERFSGSLGLVRGDTPASGPGRLYTYAVYVERGIKIDRQQFALDLRRTLFHRRGWGRTGRIAFRQVSDPSRAGTRIILASPRLVDRLCFPLRTRGYVSCQIGTSIVLNLNRWRYAVPHFKRRPQYRRMLTNHEMGHRLGLGHFSCPGRGRRAPVMQQQTYGLQGCRPNAWPLGWEVAAAR